jgi:hypothetical protein
VDKPKTFSITNIIGISREVEPQCYIALIDYKTRRTEQRNRKSLSENSFGERNGIVKIAFVCGKLQK